MSHAEEPLEQLLQRDRDALMAAAPPPEFAMLWSQVVEEQAKRLARWTRLSTIGLFGLLGVVLVGLIATGSGGGYLALPLLVLALWMASDLLAFDAGID